MMSRMQDWDLPLPGRVVEPPPDPAPPIVVMGWPGWQALLKTRPVGSTQEAAHRALVAAHAQGYRHITASPSIRWALLALIERALVEDGLTPEERTALQSLAKRERYWLAIERAREARGLHPTRQEPL